MNVFGRIATLTLALSLAFTLTACGANANSGSKGVESAQSSEASQESENAQSAQGDEVSQDSDDAQGDEPNEEAQGAYDEVVGGKGLVSTFVGTDVTNATVTNEDEAQAVVDSLVDRMGGDETTDLLLVHELSTETGNTYYIYRQELAASWCMAPAPSSS